MRETQYVECNINGGLYVYSWDGDLPLSVDDLVLVPGSDFQPEPSRAFVIAIADKRDLPIPTDQVKPVVKRLRRAETFSRSAAEHYYAGLLQPPGEPDYEFLSWDQLVKKARGRETEMRAKTARLREDDGYDDPEDYAGRS